MNQDVELIIQYLCTVCQRILDPFYNSKLHYEMSQASWITADSQIPVYGFPATGFTLVFNIRVYNQRKFSPAGCSRTISLLVMA